MKEENTVKYEVKCSGSDPFDIMCSDCPVHEIEWWEEATMEDLRNVHAEELEMDAATPDWAVKDMREQGLWNPTNPDFKEWLKERIVSGYVRIAA